MDQKMTPESSPILTTMFKWNGDSTRNNKREQALPIRSSSQHQYSRRDFCLCCLGSATFAATEVWLAPRQAFAEARGLVTRIKDSAAASPIVTHKLRGNISVLEGSGGNIAVLTGSDGKVLVDGS
jgi:hypothetical protein